MLSPYVVAIIISWCFAHLVKYIIMGVKNNSFKIGLKVFDSGGMPSAHTSVFAAVTTMIGLVEGFNSGLFALAVVMLVIVMHDAIRVRRSTGEQGLVINQIVEEQKYKINILNISKGHTPLEVLLGLLLGIIISSIVFLAT